MCLWLFMLLSLSGQSSCLCSAGAGLSRAGVTESIAGIIVIGLAVDYVIHLGHMYLEVGHLGYETRAERCAMALKNMGNTVLAGAATTFIAGLSMKLCQMSFFTQMSTLIS